MKIEWKYIFYILVLIFSFSCVTLPVNRVEVKKIKAIEFIKTVGSAGSIEGKFLFPTDVVVLDSYKDYLGRGLSPILVVDSHNNRIQVFDEYFNVINSFGSFGAENYQFNLPVSAAKYSKNYIYISDSGNNRILKYDIRGNFLGVLEIKNFSDSEKETELVQPAGISVDNGGNIYVAVKGQDRVLKISPTGYILLEIKSYGFKARYLNVPSDVAIDSSGRIYVADTGNNCAAIFDTQGELLNSIEYLKSPQGIAVDNEGNIFISETGANRVVIYNIKGEFVKKINYRFSRPMGIEVVKSIDTIIYVADSGNHRIVVFKVISDK